MKTTLAALALCIATPAMSAECFPRTEFIAFLRSEYQETPTVSGYDMENSIVVEMLSSPSGTWTLVLTKPDGETCILAAGEHFQIRGQL